MASHAPGNSNKLTGSGFPARGTVTGLPELLTIGEVAEATRLSPKTIRRRCADNTLKWHRVGPKMLRIERDSILQLLGN